MKVPYKAAVRLFAIYLCVLLVITTTAGLANEKLARKEAEETVVILQYTNPTFYELLKENATKENKTVVQYYYEKLIEVRGLNKNVIIQGIQLLKQSWEELKPIKTVKLGRAVLITLGVLLSSMLLIIFTSITVGMKISTKPSLLDFVESLARFFNGIPSWWIAVLFVFIFVIKYNILPASGLMSIPPEEGIGLAFDILKHLILPVATIVFVFVWEFIVIVARETQREFGEVYIITEIAKGMPNKVIYWKHILKNIGITLSSFTGQKFMEMFTDYLVLDAFFSLQGLGLLLKSSFVREVVPNVGVVVNFRPYLFFPLTIIIATLFFVISLVIELIKGMLDPRVS
ncbi:hypothetical protein EP1X_03825 [Thermococcus sp. EP1]|uniref:ABC transporter permease subunit n=1 Tax=Thermococcus sp. EP1 TaxID=1591054 RepID=UPI0006D956D3|nr:ABC transporter permease [Thermococcus sp. EP1]KPU63477.1 hypothetical protein EP1X_03825 [Thermococcus sp. EP1]